LIIVSGDIEIPYSGWSSGDQALADYRPDFQELFYQAALDAGARIEFGKKIAIVDIDTAAVLLEDGSTMSGDLVIGADGKMPLLLIIILPF
jgi:2-polyprenyl-6-methoxyphenol hydroxylase-like FAD-dependent oxidoreductase